MNKIVYTIGHSNHGIEYFCDLLQTHDIDIIIDGYSGSEKSSSTIVHCITEPFRIIRKGPISLKELNHICRVKK